MHKPSLIQKQSAFTLVEIMIVVAIIALLAAIAVPNYMRARKRSQYTRIIEDVRLLEAAVDQYAQENNKASGTAVSFDDLKNYLKAGTALYSGTGTDLFGDYYGPFTVDDGPYFPMGAWMLLSDVVPNGGLN